jgi:hypothetical protein
MRFAWNSTMLVSAVTIQRQILPTSKFALRFFEHAAQLTNQALDIKLEGGGSQLAASNTVIP